jgi:hypothetical protein
VDPRAVLDAVEKRKIPSPYRDSSPRSNRPSLNDGNTVNNAEITKWQTISVMPLYGAQDYSAIRN